MLEGNREGLIGGINVYCLNLAFIYRGVHNLHVVQDKWILRYPIFFNNHNTQRRDFSFGTDICCCCNPLTGVTNRTCISIHHFTVVVQGKAANLYIDGSICHSTIISLASTPKQRSKAAASVDRPLVVFVHPTKLLAQTAQHMAYTRWCTC